VTLTRRDLIRTSALSGLGLALAGGPLRFVGEAGASEGRASGGLGALAPDPAGLLDLPEGFRYDVVAHAGDLVGGRTIPGRPDGTGAFERRDQLVLVRNHEQGTSADFPVVGDPGVVYDPALVGGTTNLLLDRHRRLVESVVSLAGTASNCAGGVTPWDTWLTCEETETKAGSGGATKHHGYVFEVHPFDQAANQQPTALTALGRFAHEAVVVDPRRGDLYLTEDASAPNGLLYRFEPDDRRGGHGSLRAGGSLSAMSIAGVEDLSGFTRVGTELPVRWVAVPDPTALGPLGSTRKQFSWVDRTNRAAPVTVTRPGGEVTRSRKFEGLWWGDDRAYVVCSFARTSGSDWSVAAHDGQVWSYDPRRSVLRLEVVFPVNPSPAGATADQPDGPDNITVNPWGGLVLAEDGEGAQHLLAVDEDGAVALLARNARSGSEFTGVVFSPDRHALFANIQDEGYTFAITGPFARLHRGA
jgi:secreted PhoX family phosphatase